MSRDYEDRVVINCLKPETMLKFAQELVKKSLEKEVKKPTRSKTTK